MITIKFFASLKTIAEMEEKIIEVSKLYLHGSTERNYFKNIP